MDVWGALGIFLLGAAVGAVTTAAHYSAQIRELRRVSEVPAGTNVHAESLAEKAHENPKSA